MKVLIVGIVVAVMAASAVTLPFVAGTQSELEYILCEGFEPRDCFPDGEPPYVPHRFRNSLPEFQGFIDRNGWTTNQFLEGMMLAVSNNVTDSSWSDADKRRSAEVAVWKLGEINNPAVTNFFRWFNDNDNTERLKVGTIPPMIWYTNLEPEIMAYMRSLCVRTNVYCKVETVVMRDMFETLSTMPDALKPAATNRVAKYMYFAIRHVTDSQGWQDRELSNFIPAYSNSLQRLSLMRYVSTSATNAWERTNAAQVVQQLESVPTNQLNDIDWIAEDVPGGN